MLNSEEAVAPVFAVSIQAICTHWDKSSRGGTNALPRNRVPASARLAPVPSAPTSGNFILHRLIFTANNSFAAPSRLGVNPYCPKNTGGITLSREGNVLHVAYQGDVKQGTPKRDAGEVEALCLLPEQWGRVRYNARLSKFDNGT